jgi:hypothetical protein
MSPLLCVDDNVAVVMADGQAERHRVVRLEGMAVPKSRVADGVGVTGSGHA